MDTSTKLGDDTKLETITQCSVSSESKNDSTENTYQVDITNVVHIKKQNVEEIIDIDNIKDKVDTNNIITNISCVKIENESGSEDIVTPSIDKQSNIPIKDIKTEQESENLTDTSSNTDTVKESYEDSTTDTTEININNVKRKRRTLR